jgi:hypothetical protein
MKILGTVLEEQNNSGIYNLPEEHCTLGWGAV